MVVGFTVMNPMLESTNITQQKQIQNEMKLPPTKTEIPYFGDY